jgi:hypothetical protein
VLTFPLMLPRSCLLGDLFVKTRVVMDGSLSKVQKTRAAITVYGTITPQLVIPTGAKRSGGLRFYRPFVEMFLPVHRTGKPSHHAPWFIHIFTKGR